MDNLKLISEKVNTDIDPNGAPESILAQNHNDILQMFLQSSGKYVGLPYIIKTNYQGIISPGEMFVSGALNTPMTVFVSPKTTDGTDTQPILNIYKNGDYLHLKDFAGRSVYFTITDILDTIDNNSNQVFAIDLSPFPSNINYSYQVNEQNVGVVELLKATATATNDFFKDIELNLFWGRKGIDPQMTDCSKQVNMKKLVRIDTSGVRYYKTIKQTVYFLGINIIGFDSIKDFQPKLFIQRFKGKKAHFIKKQSGNYYYGRTAKYTKRQNESDFVVCETTDPAINNFTVERPEFIDITTNNAFYDIFAENYFNKLNIPKPYQGGNYVTKAIENVTIQDDSEVYTAMVPKKQKGYSHCELRLQITVNDQKIISKPLQYIKIINQLNLGDADANGFYEPTVSAIKFQYQ